MIACPLCTSSQTGVYQKEPFFRCGECQLVFKDPATRLSQVEEKKRYQEHQNSMENEGYVQFLKPVVSEANKHLPPRARVLDFGCGPGPVLAELLQMDGFKTFRYDPFFYPHGLENLPPLDAVTCTEAAEHFFNPQKEFNTIFSLLKPEGALILMTEIYPEGTILQDWYYTKDPSHVCFYSDSTLSWIAKKYQRQYTAKSSRLFLMTATT
jgi:2-polyprenyl-3-methyl-5-hydroxy-6-metoxy-1,4-benzoquinol methylase